MSSTSFTAAAVLLLCSYLASVLAGSDPPRCRRSTSSPEPDLSTIEGPDCFEVPGDEELASPTDNEFICYRTCIDETTVTDECEACLIRQRSLNIIAPRDEERQELYNGRAIFSPRFINMSVTYRPSTLCRYRIRCRTGQMLHYFITDHGLQASQVVMGQSRCVDFLNIFRSAVDPPGPQITCGNVMEIGEGRSDFNEDNLSVMFRTNRKVESSGFYIAVTCVSPAFQDVDGCTPAEPAQPLMGGSPGSGRKRRETEFDSLEQVFKVREKRFGFRVPCIKVPIGAAVSYEDNTIRVFRGNEWLYKFRGIRVFQVYNRAAGFLLFSGSAGGTVFRGFGFLKVGVGRAFYIQEGVNPRFRLSELERTVVLQIWTEILANTTLLAAFDYNVDDGLDEREPGRFGVMGPTAIDTRRLITNNTNACNAVVRATACIAQELTLGIPCNVTGITN